MPKLSLASLAKRVDAQARRIASLETAHKDRPALALVPAKDLRKGEIDVGPTIHEGRPARLILLADRFGPGTWDEAKAWAEKLGASLPSRIDALILWQASQAEPVKMLPAPPKFEVDRPYWTGEQSADASSYAWCQWFRYGNQTNWRKDAKSRAVAVRRAPI